MIELIFVCPEFIICHCVVSFNKELKVGVIYLSLNHPLLNHRKYWTRNLLDYSADELLSLGTTSKHVGVDRRTYSPTS
jgi:hypothetical protein